MSRIAKPHRILAMAVVATLAAAAPAAADGPNRLPTTFIAPTCGGPNEIIECAPPVKHPHSATETEAQPTCGGPGDIIECAPPVESEPRGDTPVRQA